MLSSASVPRYPMICAGINVSTTSRPRLSPLLAFYAVTSTSAIHRSKSTAIKPSSSPILEYSQTVWAPFTTNAINRVESVQRRASHYTVSRYRRTSSVTAMLSELRVFSWETQTHKTHDDPLASGSCLHVSDTETPPAAHMYWKHKHDHLHDPLIRLWLPSAVTLPSLK